MLDAAFLSVRGSNVASLLRSKTLMLCKKRCWSYTEGASEAFQIGLTSGFKCGSICAFGVVPPLCSLHVDFVHLAIALHPQSNAIIACQIHIEPLQNLQHQSQPLSKTAPHFDGDTGHISKIPTFLFEILVQEIISMESLFLGEAKPSETHQVTLFFQVMADKSRQAVERTCYPGTAYTARIWGGVFGGKPWHGRHRNRRPQ